MVNDGGWASLCRSSEEVLRRMCKSNFESSSTATLDCADHEANLATPCNGKTVHQRIHSQWPSCERASKLPGSACVIGALQGAEAQGQGGVCPLSRTPSVFDSGHRGHTGIPQAGQWPSAIRHHPGCPRHVQHWGLDRGNELQGSPQSGTGAHPPPTHALERHPRRTSGPSSTLTGDKKLQD